MRKIRGLIALAISICFAFLAAKAVYWQMNKPQPKPVQAARPKAPPPPPERFSASVPDGMRSFSVSVDKVAGLTRQLKKGDRVDIIATSPLPDNSQGHVSRIILQDIRILDIDRGDSNTKKKNRSAPQDMTVALLVSPEQGVTLAAASAASKIMLMARNLSDQVQQTVRSAAYTSEGGAESVSEFQENGADAIPGGMRAVTISIRNTDGMVGRLKRGDRVDILASCPYTRFSSDKLAPGGKGEVTEYRLASRTVLQNIEVMATERDVSLSTGLPAAAHYVTLLVTPSQAEKITVATDASKKVSLRLISRNKTDTQRVTTGGQLLSDVLLHKKHRWNHEIMVLRGKCQTMQYFK